MLATALLKARDAGEAVSYQLISFISRPLSSRFRLDCLVQPESAQSLLEMVRGMMGNAEDRPDIGKLGPGQYGDFSSVRVCSANCNIWDHYPPIFYALLRDSCFKATICTRRGDCMAR